MSAELETLLSTTRFRVVRVRGPSGPTREIVRHPGAVTILPLVDDHHICLIRNYRLAVDQTLIELPAGTMEAGEDPCDTAHRELAEETGYQAGRMELAHSFYLSPGILDERMRLYIARDLTLGEAAREAGEEIENFVVPWEDAMTMVRNGDIQDAKTIVGLMWLSSATNFSN